MTVDKAKEFLVELAENDEAAARIDEAYLAALAAEAANLGYEVSSEDLATAVVEMTGLGEDDLVEVSGFQIIDSLPWFKAPDGGKLFGNPLGFTPRTFGR